MAESASFHRLDSAIKNVLDLASDDFMVIAQLLELDPSTDLMGADLHGVNLHGADLPEADFSRANLRGSDLTGANLTRANLKDADLTGANFSQANLNSIKFLSDNNSPIVSSPISNQEQIETTKLESSQEEILTDTSLIDPLPNSHDKTQIVLIPGSPDWVYAHWDIPAQQTAIMRNQGGQQLVLRLYDVTNVDLACQVPHSMQEYPCDESVREWYIPLPLSNREYLIEIGYRCEDGRWLFLARSESIYVSPHYSFDWGADGPSTASTRTSIYDEVFGMAKGVEALRAAGSLYGSMLQDPVHESALSSYVFPSGVGLYAIPTASGINMSGVGFSASAPPIRPRQFWLVADAELIVYGATEPDATVTIGGQPIQLNPDGTFRFQMSFQDGLIDYPIMAVAADGEQSRSIHMKFNRETPERRTNTKEEAILEWLV